MTDIALGTLEWLDPRTVWRHEAHAFTPWLRENIHLLGKALGLEIDADVQREVTVGLFSADLLGTDVGSRAGILIENQLEQTDHSHLGQLLTYAGGLDTDILVWVSTKVREEHRQALTWLNERTRDGVYFFGVEIELLQIGESLPAPHFKVVAAPNDWQKAQAGRVATPSGGGRTSEKAEQYRKYWSRVLTAILARDPSFTSASPERAPMQNWCSFSGGRSGFANGMVFGWEDSQEVIRVELYIDTGDWGQNKAAFDALYAKRSEIEAAFGEPLVWTRRDDIRASRVYVKRPGSVTADQASLDEYSAWLIDRLFRLRSVFGPIVKTLVLPAPGMTAAEDSTDPTDRI